MGKYILVWGDKNDKCTIFGSLDEVATWFRQKCILSVSVGEDERPVVYDSNLDRNFWYSKEWSRHSAAMDVIKYTYLVNRRVGMYLFYQIFK
jgi:hypothetical protein